ncbi:MAG TPA: 23S rRNA (adenine(2503)-C(2))-methyltransferase RlmN [Candidatus Methylomirabilis sp.]|nr:23S rRNA (adenine(2503)-C(2))-methyltransferase RlmN [Candidatus Methylomirabilis sp.]
MAEKLLELLGKSKEELRAMCAAMGEPAYRGGQIYHALYAERKFDVARMTNLPAAFRARLANEATITLPEVRQRFASADGSVRYLLSLAEVGRRADFNTEETGEHEKDSSKKETERPKREKLANAAAVEAVFMPSEGRQTICISTQAGCAVNCQFCLTAQLGLIRNLTAAEIVGQVLVALEENRPAHQQTQETPSAGNKEQDAGLELGAKWVGARDARRMAAGKNKGKNAEANAGTAAPSEAHAAADDQIQTNVVLMGQGEPLLNFDAVMAALRIMLDAEGIGLSPKHVTLSTSGIVPGIERLALEKVRPKLAISLNASNDEQRDVLMPINKKYPLSVLLEACKKYPLRPWEHLTFEYVMLGGVNDAPEDARRVVRLLAPLRSVKVNLIPWNPGELPYHESSPERIEEFRRILTDKGVPAFVRYSRGRDVMAACGQLALLQIQGSSAPHRTSSQGLNSS